MNQKLLEVAAAVAGIGGIGFAVFLLLCRDIIRKNIFPKMSPAHAYSIIRLIIILSFCIALAGLGAWVFSNFQEQTRHRSAASTPMMSSAPISMVPIVPRLSWEQDDTIDKLHWHLKIENGPVFNLEIDSFHGVAFWYFPPGSNSSRSSLISFRLFPTWSSGSEKNQKLDFSEVNKQLFFLADRFTETISQNDEQSYFQYFLYVLASYESEAGVKYQRAWVFDREAKSSRDIAKFDYKLKTTSVNEYRGEHASMDMVAKCKRFLMPSTETAVDWKKLIRTPCGH